MSDLSRPVESNQDRSTDAVGCQEVLSYTNHARNELDLDYRNSLYLAQAEELSQLGCFDWDLETNQLRWTDGLFRIYGLQPQQFTATLEGFMDRVLPEDRPEVMRSIQQAIANCGGFVNVERIVHSSGEIRTLESRGKVLVDANGKARKLIGVCHDITQQTELSKSQEIQIKGLKLLADSASLVLVKRDTRRWESLILDLAKLLECDGYANYSLIDGKLVLDSMAGVPLGAVDRFRVIEIGQGMCGTCAQTRQFTYVPETELKTHPQGEELRQSNFRMCVAIPLMADDSVLGTMTFASRTRSELTTWELDFVQTIGQLVSAAKAQRFIENQIRDSEQRFRTLVDNTADALIVYDAKGFILEVNRATCDALLYPRQELLGRNLRDGLIVEDGEPSTLSETQKKFPCTALITGGLRRKDGSIFPVEVRANAIEYHGQPAVLAAVRDTTARLEEEKQKRRAEETRRLILEQANMVTWEANPSDLTFSLLYGPCEALLGACAEYWRQPGFWLERVHPNDLDAVREKLAQAVHSRQRFECRMRHTSGHFLWVEIFAEALKEKNEVERLRGVMSDISARKGLEDSLRHSQKMEAIGRLAGGVAHDFNNMLTVISTSADLLMIHSSMNHETCEIIKSIQDAVARAQGLTSQLLLFGRNSIPRQQYLNLNEVVTNICRLLNRVIGEQIRLSSELAPDLPSILMDPSQLDQVIINLAVNARDAMPRGGNLLLRTSLSEVDNSLSSFADLAPGKYVELTVSDSGCGMSEEIVAKIFEPFFTTKPFGLGSGLGLSVVYGVIRDAGGAIQVESTPGQGSSFRIKLPAASSVQVADQVLGKPSIARGNERVLLVEDEPSVSRVTSMGLRLYGYQVLEANSASQAMQIARSLQGNIDLLITDLVMPLVNGTELAKEILHNYPNVKVLCLSGYSPSTLLSGSDDLPFLAKPFSIQELVSKIREVLDSGNSETLIHSGSGI